MVRKVSIKKAAVKAAKKVITDKKIKYNDDNSRVAKPPRKTKTSKKLLNGNSSIDTEKPWGQGGGDKHKIAVSDVALTENGTVNESFPVDVEGMLQNNPYHRLVNDDRITIINGTQKISINLLGARVTSYKAGGIEKIWTSDEGNGGIPVAFRTHTDDGADAGAGIKNLVDEALWSVRDMWSTTQEGMKSSGLCLTTKSSNFEIEYLIALLDDGGLQMTLNVTNINSTNDLNFKTSIKSFFRFEDTSKIYIDGVNGLEYVDNRDGLKVKTQDLHERFIVDKVVDRMFLKFGAKKNGVSVVENRKGIKKTVVKLISSWTEMAVFSGEEGESKQMLCLEPTVEKAITAKAGEQWTETSTIQFY